MPRSFGAVKLLRSVRNARAAVVEQP